MIFLQAWASLYLSIFLHEMGHYFALRIFNKPVAIVAMGRRPLVRFRLGNTTFFFGFPWEFSGWVLQRTDGLVNPDVNIQALFYSAGMIVNLLLMSVSAAWLIFDPEFVFGWCMLASNAFLILISAIPIRLRRHGSAAIANDARLILDLKLRGFVDSPGLGYLLSTYEYLSKTCDTVGEKKYRSYLQAKQPCAVSNSKIFGEQKMR